MYSSIVDHHNKNLSVPVWHQYIYQIIEIISILIQFCFLCYFNTGRISADHIYNSSLSAIYHLSNTNKYHCAYPNTYLLQQ